MEIGSDLGREGDSAGCACITGVSTGREVREKGERVRRTTTM